jgi:hypothetical protein
MTLTLTLTFLAVLIFAVIYSKSTDKTSQQHYIKWLSHASSLTNITVYCIWIIGCLLMIMQILLMSGVYNVSLFPWVVFEAPLIGAVIVLLLTLGGIKRQMTHDNDNDNDNDERKKQRRVIVKTLFLQMICVSFTSVLFAINLLVQEI